MWKTVCFSFGLAIAAVVAPTTSALADLPPPSMLCDTRPPDASLTLGPGVPQVSSTSPNGAYGDRLGCQRWVVQIAVPHDSSANGMLKSFTINSDVPFPDTKAACESMEVNTTYFRKLFTQQSFTRYALVAEKGVWHAGDMFPCSLVAQPGAAQPPAQYSPPLGGTTTYRVARSVKINGVWKKVTISAAHQPLPPT